MNTGSLVFFANYLPSNFDNKVSSFFNFETFNYSNNLTAPIGKDKNIITGQILPSTGQFWTRKQNAAFISGNYIKLNNFEKSSINLNNFTYLVSFEKLNLEGGVLFSCIQKNTGLFLNSDKNFVNQEYFKGFEFGVTSNNYLYFEYFQDNGPAVFVNKNKINDKSVVYLSISNSNINFGYIDFLNQSTVDQNNQILSNYLFDPTGFYIGYNPEAQNLYSNNKRFVGYVEDIILTSPYLFNYEILNLSSGFIYNYSGEGQTVFSFITTGVTGTYQAITGYQTEITGWETIETGTITDEWGFTVMGYIEQPLIVQIPLSGTFNLSGEILVTETGFRDVAFNLENDKFISYQKNVINFLNKIDNQDLIESRLLTGYTNSQFNNKNIFLPYERYGNFYINNSTAPFYNLFANGQLQKSGDILTVTSPYNNTNEILIEDDFGVNSNNNIIFKNFYGLAGESSVILEASKSQNIYLGEIENLGSGISIGSLDNDVFLNGQKLTEGIHYSVNNNYDLRYELQNLFDINSYRSSRINNDESVIIVGDYEQNNKGVVAIYTGNSILGWNVKQTITGILNNGYFGSSLTINSSANLLMVGSFGSNKVSIYTGDANNGWKYKNDLPSLEYIQISEGQLETLYNAVGRFGFATTSNNDGTVLVVGAPTHDNNRGGVIIFTGDSNNDWKFKQKLESINNYKQLGHSLDMNNDCTVLIIGAPDTLSAGSGTAIIYTGNSLLGWGIKNILRPNTNNGYFGWNVACNGMGNVCVVGSLTSDGAYIYTGDLNNEWVLKQKIPGNIGSSITINDNGTVIATAKDVGSSTIIFTGNSNIGWAFHQEIPSGKDSPYHGKHLSLNNDGSIFVQGAPDLSVNAGALVYSLNNIKFNNYSTLSGSIILASQNFDLKRITSGTPILPLNSNFYANNTEIYVNGVRQTLNFDYLELSKQDVTTGVKILLENNNDYIYNNEGFIR